MNLPRVSILLPVHNEAAFLPAAIKSLQRQSETDWELIAVNDGSTDGSTEILASAATHDQRIRVIDRPAEGLVAALNAGLEHCRAPLIARMDGDDICHPRRLKLQADHLEHQPGTTLVSCRIRHIPRALIKAGLLAYERWQNNLNDHAAIMRDLFVESPFAHPSVMYRKAAILALEGYRDMGWAEDYDLWLRLAQSGAGFARIPQVLLYWRDRPDRLSRTASHYTLQSFRNCKAHFLCQGFLREVREVTLWGAGQEGKAWRRVLARHNIGVCSWIEVDPRKIGQTIHGAAVLGQDRLSTDVGKILVTIGAKGAREQVRAFASAKGLTEGQDYLCVT